MWPDRPTLALRPTNHIHQNLEIESFFICFELVGERAAPDVIKGLGNVPILRRMDRKMFKISRKSIKTSRDAHETRSVSAKS